jgi:hypothetical protein
LAGLKLRENNRTAFIYHDNDTSLENLSTARPRKTLFREPKKNVQFRQNKSPALRAFPSSLKGERDKE